MTREISKHYPVMVEEDKPPHDMDPRGWLADRAAKLQAPLLLAHALDGVIWGRWDGSKLITAREAADAANHALAAQVSAELRADTLQEARLFDAHRELHIWRSGDGWQGRWIRPANDGETPVFTECIAEQHILWGDTAEPVGSSFTLMSDGAQGLRHVVPLAVNGARPGIRPLRLTLRHYLADEVVARVVVSRLVGLEEDK